MAKKLILKMRPNEDEVTVPLVALSKMLTKSDKEFADMFRQVIANRDGAIHDKRWLELIAAHQVEGGKAVSEMIQWAGLRKRIDALDATVDGKTFTLSAAQDEMIKKRLKDPSFKVAAFPAQFAAFLMEYCRTPPVWHFDENDEENWADPDAVELAGGERS